ncbi:UNKNOWN [Stylonychia lemnae]|uniref:Transmembrane protein n=1 Tax=Stylonychia lemnae TaxID=5949 RepID=A0A078ADF9_STYLE|nr:UNKNOWN [Stylonychia lemnae]|eukprot:CDW80284.1 UNKNOWN [Stylonychia lemnae]
MYTSANDQLNSQFNNKITFYEQYKQPLRFLQRTLVPISITAMCGTITYPIAVRITRSRIFKLRNFYAIHIAIAPFLSVIHLNIFAALHMYFNIKQKEDDKITTKIEYGQYYNILKEKLLKKEFKTQSIEYLQKFENSKERKELYDRLDQIEKDDYKIGYDLKQYLKNRF